MLKFSHNLEIGVFKMLLFNIFRFFKLFNIYRLLDVYENLEISEYNNVMNGNKRFVPYISLYNLLQKLRRYPLDQCAIRRRVIQVNRIDIIIKKRVKLTYLCNNNV